MEQVWQTAYDTLIAILTTPQNVVLLLLSWGLVEAFAPIVEWTLASRKLKTQARLRLYGLARVGKRLGATLWCSALVWLPHAQPPLCGDDMLDGCHTLIDRLATAVVLGLALSLGHNVVAKTIRRVTGNRKKHRVICANCRGRIQIETLDDPCSKCGEKPHEVTRQK